MSLKNDETAQNALNLQLHSQPWYQAWLRSQGQNPSLVKLSDEQRRQLEQVAAQHGTALPQDVHFDPSGNVNEQHGFAGWPTWAKVAAVAAPVAAADFFTGGAVHGALQGGLSAAFGGGGGATAGTAGASLAEPTATSLASGLVLPGTISATGVPIAATAAGGGLGILNTLKKGADVFGTMANGASRQRAEDRGAQALYNVNAAGPRMQAERMRLGQLAGADLSSSMHAPTDPRAEKFMTAGGLSPDTLQLIRSRAMNALQNNTDVPTMPRPGNTDRLLNVLDYAGQASKFLKPGGF